MGGEGEGLRMKEEGKEVSEGGREGKKRRERTGRKTNLVVGLDSSVGVSLELANHSDPGVGAVASWVELKAALVGGEGFVVASEANQSRTRRGNQLPLCLEDKDETKE